MYFMKNAFIYISEKFVLSLTTFEKCGRVRDHKINPLNDVDYDDDDDNIF